MSIFRCMVGRCIQADWWAIGHESSSYKYYLFMGDMCGADNKQLKMCVVLKWIFTLDTNTYLHQLHTCCSLVSPPRISRNKPL